MLQWLAMTYKRVLLKLSGEQLAGKFDGGIDIEFCAWLASEIKPIADSGEPAGTKISQ